MAGFLLAIPGIKQDGTQYLHSHMLGVLKEYRDAGDKIPIAESKARISARTAGRVLKRAEEMGAK